VSWTRRSSKERADKATKEAADATKAASIAATVRTALLAKIAKDGGGAEVMGLEFVAGKADLAVDRPTVVAALDALVVFGGACDDLRFEIGVQQAKGEDAKGAETLASERAATLKKYLVDHKVDAAKVKSAAGHAGVETSVTVTVAKKCG
jgi:Fe-S cluster biogenesis protein NfuA